MIIGLQRCQYFAVNLSLIAYTLFWILLNLKEHFFEKMLTVPFKSSVNLSKCWISLENLERTLRLSCHKVVCYRLSWIRGIYSRFYQLSRSSQRNSESFWRKHFHLFEKASLIATNSVKTFKLYKPVAVAVSEHKWTFCEIRTICRFSETFRGFQTNNKIKIG